MRTMREHQNMVEMISYNYFKSYPYSGLRRLEVVDGLEPTSQHSGRADDFDF